MFFFILGYKISSWKKLGLKRSTHHWFWDSMVLHHLLSSSRWCWMLMMVVLCFCLFFGKASLYISLKISLNGMKIVCIFFLYEQNTKNKKKNNFIIVHTNVKLFNSIIIYKISNCLKLIPRWNYSSTHTPRLKKAYKSFETY